MDWILVAGGSLLIAMVIVDLLWTTLWVEGGAGPVTRSLGETLWRFLRALSGGSHRVLSTAGPIVLVLTLLFWIAMLWAGWTLVFSAAPGAVVSSSSQVPGDFVSRFYFVGYSIFTLGNGDFKPNGETWQILTGIAAGTGLLLITLAITYLLSVVSAVVSARAFAVQVHGLGASADEAVAASWNGKDLSALDWYLQNANSALVSLSQQYLAYPVLRYFHGSDPSSSDALAFLRLEQLVLLAGVVGPAESRPASTLLQGTRSSLNSLLSALPSRVAACSDAQPTAMSTDAVRFATDGQVDSALLEQGLGERKRQLGAFAALAREHGWEDKLLRN